MSTTVQYAGVTSTPEVRELHFVDEHELIAIRLPREGLDLMCGRSLSTEEIETVLFAHFAHVEELPPLFARALARCGDYTIAMWESGVSHRRLDISMDDIRGSGITLSTTFLDTAKASGFQAR